MVPQEALDKLNLVMPLSGTTQGVFLEVTKLERPYTPISKEEYDLLCGGDTDYYLSETGRVTTFGQSGYLHELMPLNEQASDDVLACHELTQEQYAHAQKRVERLSMANAKGEDTPEGDALLSALVTLMDASPWTIDPDSGEIVNRFDVIRDRKA